MIPFLYVLLDSTQYSSDRLPAWMLTQVSNQGRQLYLFLAGMDHSGAALPMRKRII
jgi:hypothetical protein